MPKVFRRKKEEEPSKSEEEIRSEEGRKAIIARDAERKEREEAEARIIKDADVYFDGVAKETGLTKLEVTNKILENDVMLIEFNETTGKASLIYKSWESTLPALGETQELSETVIREFRNLRKNFAPISAGVEWHRDFTSGGGFTVQVDNPKDKHKKEMQDEIKTFCGEVYQDQYTMGLDKILDIAMDTALTDGCAAAEIVYDVEVDFMDYVKGFEPVIVKDKNGKKIEVQIMVPKEPDWHGTLKGITRLKIIDNAYNRLRPYRHPTSGEVLFWTLDEKADVAQWATRETINKDCIKFHPWEIFWLSWNQTGTNLKGDSIIRPVYSVAKFVKAIQNAVGVGFNRWANKKYFFVCVGEGTDIWTPEGYRPIETISIGDKVWNQYSGVAEVLQTFKRQYKGDMITVKPKLLESVSFTVDHPIKTARKRRLRTKEGHKQYLTQFEIQSGYKRADELTTKDYVIVPKLKESHDIWVDFPNLSHREGYAHGRNPDILPSQYLSEELAKLFGWYLSEGSINSKDHYTIQFSLNINETHFAQEILDLAFQTLGLKGKIYKNSENNSLQVVFGSKVLATFLDKWFGHGANDKHLPDTFLYWKPEILNSMISRILMGDGYLDKDNWWKLKLNSKVLQKQLQLALLKLGHRAGLSIVERNPVGIIRGRKVNFHNAWMLTWNENNKVVAEDEDNYYFRIKEITKTPFEGYVYNFHASTNEMLLPFRTHQCGTEKRPWSKPAQTAFLKAMAQMIKHNYVGIPVPAGFDIKNIGGEGTVFEGKSLLDYLTGQICTGMQFPRDFLETGKTQASDKSWLAWTVRYGRNQQQVRRAVEQQLWKRCLWCLHGKDYRISKKGVPVGDQEHRLIYVPKLQWRAEGRWHREKKVELFKSLLDAANPIDPPLKMAVQKGIADVLGFGEIDWSTIIDLFEVRSETNLLTAKLEKLVAEAKFKEAEELGVEGLLKQLQEREKAKLAQAQPEKPVEVPTEQELERRAEARFKGGVSRTPKGEARPVGGTREPKRVPTGEFKDNPENISSLKDLIPEYGDKVEKLIDSQIKTEKTKQEQIITETKRLKTEIDSLNAEAEQRKRTTFEESEERKKTEELRQQKLRIEIAAKHTELLKEQGSLLPKEQADELAKAMLETQRKEQERIDMETAKAKAEFERQQKKIELLDELEERMKKKKKTIRTEESKPLPFVTHSGEKVFKPKEATTKPPEPQEIKLDINVKSEPVKAEVDVNVKSPKEIEETKEREKAELELIGEQKKLMETQKEMLEEEKLERENEKETKRKLRERKKKVLDKIEKEIDGADGVQMEESKHSRTKCMVKNCNKPPEIEVLWAEGMGHAWFCQKHFEVWKKKPTDMSNTGTYEGDIVKTRKIDGEASEKWSEPVKKKKVDEDE